MDCIFCKIAEHSAHAEILFEDEKVISFLDINPVNFGHTLVVSRGHYPDFLSVPSEELEGLIVTAQKISEIICKKLKCDGFNIVINNGIAAGQSVTHFHIHIIPRFTNDDFRFRLNLKKYADDSMREYADKFREELNN